MLRCACRRCPWCGDLLRAPELPDADINGLTHHCGCGAVWGHVLPGEALDWYECGTDAAVAPPMVG